MNGGFFPSVREYSSRYGLPTAARRCFPATPWCFTRTDAAGYGDRFFGADSPQSAVLQQFPTVSTCGWRCCFHVLVGTGSAAQKGGRAPHERVARGVRLYGEGERVDVLVDDGQIAEIGAGLDEAAGFEKDLDVIDATGQVLLPGWSTCTPTCASRP